VSAPTAPDPRIPVEAGPDRIRTICCVCRELVHHGASPDGLVSHGVHPGECARRMLAGEAA
jgi:hypothetical protein